MLSSEYFIDILKWWGMLRSFDMVWYSAGSFAAADITLSCSRAQNVESGKWKVESEEEQYNRQHHIMIMLDVTLQGIVYRTM
jgi:hypothetical protein